MNSVISKIGNEFKDYSTASLNQIENDNYNFIYSLDGEVIARVSND